MKKLLLVGTALTALFGGSALAADLRPRPYTPPPAPVFSWTGFYIGGNLGGAWARGSVNDSLFGLSAGTTADSLAAANSGSTTNSATLFSARNGTSTGIARRDREWPFCSWYRNSSGSGKHALDIDAGR